MKDVSVDASGALHCPYCGATHFDVAARNEETVEGGITVRMSVVLRLRCLECGEWSRAGDPTGWQPVATPPEVTSSRRDPGREWDAREAARTGTQLHERTARRRAAWAAAAQEARARQRGEAAAIGENGPSGTARREGALSPEERRAYWKQMDEQLAAEQRARAHP
jgi:hypothetical protein